MPIRYWLFALCFFLPIAHADESAFITEPDPAMATSSQEPTSATAGYSCSACVPGLGFRYVIYYDGNYFGSSVPYLTMGKCMAAHDADPRCAG